MSLVFSLIASYQTDILTLRRGDRLLKEIT